MNEPAHSLKNTILLLLQRLELDPARVIARMGPKCRFNRIVVANRSCGFVHAIDEAGAKRLGIALPAFALAVAKRGGWSATTAGDTLVVHVRTYRDGATGALVRYADVEKASDLLQQARPISGRIDVPRSDGQRPRLGFREDRYGGIGDHPADF